MKIIETEINGLLIIELNVFFDKRGYFSETFSSQRLKELGVNTDFVQDNISVSKKGVLRGLHYQVLPKAQAKLCQVLKGVVVDIAVDIRVGSPTYGQHFSLELSSENHLQLFIPPGFAHGFAVLSDEAIFHYKCSNYYSKEHERSIRFDDPNLNIDWKVQNPIVSNKDKNANYFKNINKDFKY